MIVPMTVRIFHVVTTYGLFELVDDLVHLRIDHTKRWDVLPDHMLQGKRQSHEHPEGERLHLVLAFMVALHQFALLIGVGVRMFMFVTHLFLSVRSY